MTLTIRQKQDKASNEMHCTIIVCKMNRHIRHQQQSAMGYCRIVNCGHQTYM